MKKNRITYHTDHTKSPTEKYPKTGVTHTPPIGLSHTPPIGVTHTYFEATGKYILTNIIQRDQTTVFLCLPKHPPGHFVALP